MTAMRLGLVQSLASSLDRLCQMPDCLPLVFASPVRGVAISLSTRGRSLRSARDDDLATTVLGLVD